MFRQGSRRTRIRRIKRYGNETFQSHRRTPMTFETKYWTIASESNWPKRKFDAQSGSLSLDNLSMILSAREETLWSYLPRFGIPPANRSQARRLCMLSSASYVNVFLTLLQRHGLRDLKW
nr:unnamed protein product [Spirometra erinaceieuropaei]